MKFACPYAKGHTSGCAYAWAQATFAKPVTPVAIGDALRALDLGQHQGLFAHIEIEEQFGVRQKGAHPIQSPQSLIGSVQ